MSFLFANRAVNPHYKSYYLAAPQGNGAVHSCDEAFRDESLRIDTGGHLDDVHSNAAAFVKVKATIKKDIETLRDLSYLAADVKASSIKKWLDKLDGILFFDSDRQLVSSGELAAGNEVHVVNHLKSMVARRYGFKETADAYSDAGFKVYEELMRQYRNSAGKYIKLCGSDAVTDIFTGNGNVYITKSEYLHNLKVVISRGLHDTFTDAELSEIKIIRAKHDSPRAFFTYPHGLSYFRVEQEDDSRCVTLADVCRIHLEGWDNAGLFRCFLSPYLFRLPSDSSMTFCPPINCLKKKR